MGIFVWAALVVTGWLRWPSLAAFVVIVTTDVAPFSSGGGRFADLPPAPDLAFRYGLMLTAYLAAYWAGRTAYRLVKGQALRT